MAHVLVVDDDRSIRRTLEKFLQGEGHRVTTASDGREALTALDAGGFEAVLLDLGLPQVDGLTVLERVAGGAEAPPVIVVSARDDMQSTVRAVQLGAYEYLVKPVDVDRLRLTLKRAIESCASRRRVDELVAEAAGDYQVGNIVGTSRAIHEVYKAIGSVSTSRASVLIVGESGTGKELVAKAIHYASADRDKPFLPVNCTALSRELLESELFGHVRGAFTGAIADKPGRFELAGDGTLFLDEVAEIPIDLQAKLLRVLQERVFERVGDARPVPLRARIVAATHRDLDAMVRAGTFREDLLYRLRVVEMRLPPLRERPEDIPVLVESLLCKINRELHKRVRFVSPEAMALLSAYPWPGNVRELENALMRAVVLAKGDAVELELLPLGPTPAGPPTSRSAALSQPAPQSSARNGSSGAGAHDGATEIPALAAPQVLPLREVERMHIEHTLRVTGWNKRRASALLDISRPTLDRKIDEYGLRRPGD
jgi:two-component system response regulator AtoC